MARYKGFSHKKILPEKSSYKLEEYPFEVTNFKYRHRAETKEECDG